MCAQCKYTCGVHGLCVRYTEGKKSVLGTVSLYHLPPRCNLYVVLVYRVYIVGELNGLTIA